MKFCIHSSSMSKPLSSMIASLVGSSLFKSPDWLIIASSDAWTPYALLEKIIIPHSATPINNLIVLYPF
ncbi:hypothetical protein TSAR_008603 [Trichomalopsis sarcophagae]|uniref:Uncharacterized protein n=1 Tax=Trichomalopsis sarcophagae TaxID=543379 RepID=A0A232FAQ8_9HYME|nr:hypothetical protein TSAR_008603 [Trichomalopsis sarcophagae]